MPQLKEALLKQNFIRTFTFTIILVYFPSGERVDEIVDD